MERINTKAGTYVVFRLSDIGRPPAFVEAAKSGQWFMAHEHHDPEEGVFPGGGGFRTKADAIRAVLAVAPIEANQRSLKYEHRSISHRAAADWQ